MLERWRLGASRVLELERRSGLFTLGVEGEKTECSQRHKECVQSTLIMKMLVLSALVVLKVFRLRALLVLEMRLSEQCTQSVKVGCLLTAGLMPVMVLPSLCCILKMLPALN